MEIKRALNVQKHSKDGKRENIFYGRCTIQGRDCSLTIDKESYSNMASTSLIEKLGLQPLVHAHPYNILCLSRGNDLQVISRCLVAISIDKTYFDEIWCVIIPMDVCLALLGRPSLLDKRVTHDGYLNTVLFSKEKKSFALLHHINWLNANHK